MKSSSQEVSAITAALSAYIAGAIRKPLPREVAARARLHLVDTFAAMISGSRLLPGRQGISYVKTLGGKPEAGVIGCRIVTMAAKGSFENPLTPEEENEKALDLIVPVLGKARSRALLKALWGFDGLKDRCALRRLYAA